MCIVVKADMQGPAEALTRALTELRLENEESYVVIKVLVSNVGKVTKADVAVQASLPTQTSLLSVLQPQWLKWTMQECLVIQYNISVLYMTLLNQWNQECKKFFCQLLRASTLDQQLYKKCSTLERLGTLLEVNVWMIVVYYLRCRAHG